MTVECPICGKELKDTRGLSGHLKLAHNKTKNDIHNFDDLTKDSRKDKTIDKIRELYDKLIIFRKQRAEVEAQKQEDGGMFEALFGSEKVEQEIIHAYEAEEKRIERDIKELVKEVEKEAGTKSGEEEKEDDRTTFLI